MPLRPIPVPSSSGLLSGEAGCVHALAVYETTGAASASFVLYDGSNTKGLATIPVTLGANESIREWFGRHHYPFEGGIWFQLVSGSVGGTVVYDPGHNCRNFWEAYDQIAAIAALLQQFPGAQVIGG